MAVPIGALKIGGGYFYWYYPVYDRWVQHVTTAYGGYNAFGAVAKNIIYYGCGYSAPNDLYDWHSYNPITDAWTDLADFPDGNGRSQGACFAIKDKVYAGMGTHGSGHYASDMYEYDPRKDLWTPITAFPALGRRDAIGFAIGNYGYILGGWRYQATVYTYFKDLWRYDPKGNSWLQMADLAHEVCNTNAFVIKGIAYIATGRYPVIPDNWSKRVYAYDSKDNSWTQLADFDGEGRSGACAFIAHGKGYIMTGADTVGNRKDLWQFDPDTGIWTQKADLPAPYKEQTAFNSLASPLTVIENVMGRERGARHRVKGFQMRYEGEQL